MRPKPEEIAPGIVGPGQGVWGTCSQHTELCGTAGPTQRHVSCHLQVRPLTELCSKCQPKEVKPSFPDGHQIHASATLSDVLESPEAANQKCNCHRS